MFYVRIPCIGLHEVVTLKFQRIDFYAKNYCKSTATISSSKNSIFFSETREYYLIYSYLHLVEMQISDGKMKYRNIFYTAAGLRCY